jgi:hypothetical protein
MGTLGNWRPRVENVQAARRTPRIELQIGYLKKLPSEYVGERHIVTVAQLPNGHYQWEERPGAPPANEADGELPSIIRVIFVGAKDGRCSDARLNKGIDEDNHQTYS